MRLLLLLIVVIAISSCAPNRPEPEFVRYSDVNGTTWWGHDTEAHKIESWSFYCDSVVLWSYTYTPATQTTIGGKVVKKGTITRQARSVGKVSRIDKLFYDEVDDEEYLTFDVAWRAYGSGNTPIVDYGVYETWFLYRLSPARDSGSVLQMGRLGLPNEKQWYYTFYSEESFDPGVTLIYP